MNITGLHDDSVFCLHPAQLIGVSGSPPTPPSCRRRKREPRTPPPPGRSEVPFPRGGRLAGGEQLLPLIEELLLPSEPGGESESSLLRLLGGRVLGGEGVESCDPGTAPPEDEESLLLLLSRFLKEPALGLRLYPPLGPPLGRDEGAEGRRNCGCCSPLGRSGALGAAEPGGNTIDRLLFSSSPPLGSIEEAVAGGVKKEFFLFSSWWRSFSASSRCREELLLS